MALLSRAVALLALSAVVGCARPDADLASMPAHRAVVMSDGVRIHYIEQGAGPAILLVPGWTMPARIWEGQLAALRGKNRVIAMDPRNQGQSDRTAEGNFPERRATDIYELVKHRQLNPVVLVGWSLGVRELVTYTRLFGTGTLAGLVLVDGEVWTEPTADRRRAQASFIHNVNMRRAAFTSEFVRGMFATLQTPEYLDALMQDSLGVPASAAVSMLTDLYLENDMRVDVAAIDVPVLAVMRTAHADQLDVIKKAQPSAQTALFEHSGHALFVDEAARFNELLDRFVAGLGTAKR